MNWTKEIFQDMAKFASRAPSVHNVQPWKVQFTPDGFSLYQSQERRLLVGDPKLHDNDVSLGAFLELCHMYLLELGFHLEIQQSSQSPLIKHFNETLEKRFEILLTPTTPTRHPLYDFVLKRRSYRGIFDRPLQNEDISYQDIVVDGLQMAWITGEAELKSWASRYDESSAALLSQPGSFSELRHWMRFSETHPEYFKDGLNKQALSLGQTEAIAGRLLFRKGVFRALSAIHLEKELITEAPQIRSGTGLVVLYVDKNLSSLEAGRAFVQFWLQLTVKSFYACPLSALVDFTESRNTLMAMAPGDDIICLNVLRFGKVKDESKIYFSPRLDYHSIIIS